MTIQRYRRKPEEPRNREIQFAARYVPGEPLDDLLTVARKADSAAEVAEVRFKDTTVLLVRYERVPDDRAPEVDYETVEAGDYLAYSGSYDSLYDADEAEWRQFYDLIPDGDPTP